MNFQETESQFAVLAESLPQLVWSTRPDGYHDYFNRRWCEFTGLSSAQSLGEGWSTAIHPDDWPEVQSRWRTALETGRPYESEYRIRRADGSYAWVLSRGMPIQDLSGRILRWFGTCTIIDDRKKAEEALQTLERQYRLALEAARLGTWKIDMDRKTVSWDEGTCALFNIPHNGLFSMSLEEAMQRIHPDDRDLVRQRMAEALANGSDGRYRAEYRTIMPDGGTRWIRSNGQSYFVPGEGGPRAAGLSGVISDITDQRAAEEAQQLLTRELTHRVKNLFAIANGMVSMTARTARDPKEMANALRGRLSALSRAHELIQPVVPTEGQIGAEVGLEQLVEAVLAPYRQEDSSRIFVEGPDIRVGANTTTSLALVLHELATNAAKYGCLSKPGGRLAIHWWAADGNVDFEWLETGGPSIEAPPSFQGFGSQLSQRSITGQLGGTLERDWRAEGLCVHMCLPLSRLTG